MDPDDFGTTAMFGTVKVYGIFEAASEVVLRGSEAGVITVSPVLTVPSDHVPSNAGHGDPVHIANTVYSVAEIQFDGSGLTRVILERK